MTADQLRRTIRAEMHAARCLDKDQSEVRLWNDARELDRRMTEAGHPPEHPTRWGTDPKILDHRNALHAAKKAPFFDDRPLADTEA